MSRQVINPGSAPILWSTVEEAFRNINQNFTEIYATIAEDLSTQVVDFSNLYSDVSPGITEVYDLGTVTRRWKDLYLSGTSIYLGNAQITASGSIVQLPAGSTVGGALLDNAYFKEIAVAGQSNIVAESGGLDILTVASGNAGIAVTTNSTTDTLTISNSGVLRAIGTTGQIGVSGDGTGVITFTNLGVTSIINGQGIDINQSTQNVTITNLGLIGVDPGLGITVSSRDPITGRITITNSQPNIPQNVWNQIDVNNSGIGQPSLLADSTIDILTIRSIGDGLAITTNTTSDTLTFQNTGVTSISVGNGLTINAGTGSINLTLNSTLTRNIIGDVVGSVFADDSSMLVDATNGRIVGPVFANVTGNLTGNVTGNVSGSAGSAAVAGTVDITDTNGLTTVYYPTFVENRTTGQIVRADVDLKYRTDTNTLTAPSFAGNLTGTVTGNIFTNLIDSADSSQIVVTPLMRFESDVVIENEVFVRGSKIVLLNDLKSLVAASTSFADFQAKIAALS